MYQIIIVIHILLSLSIIGLVLIQRGKGADMGAGFGGGASQTLFGSSGSGSFLTRTTAILATAFFVSCIALSYVAVSMKESPDAYLPEVSSTPVAETPPVTGLPAAPDVQKEAPASESMATTPDSAASIMQKEGQ